MERVLEPGQTTLHSNSKICLNLYLIYFRVLGRPNQVRSLVKRAIEISKDDFHGVYNFAIEFERKFGTLEDLETMEKKYKEKLDKINQVSIVIADDLTIHEPVEIKNNTKQEYGSKQELKRNHDRHMQDHPNAGDDSSLREDKMRKMDRKPVFGDSKYLNKPFC